MAAWMPIGRGALLAPVIFLYGATLQNQRLDDRAPPLTIDHAMDARIGAYVPVARASEIARTPEAELQAAYAWRSGRTSGRFRSPMPTRYGDGDEGMGVRTELVLIAIRLSNRLLYHATHCQDRHRAERLFVAALEPLRTVQYADLATLTEIDVRRRDIEFAMHKHGFSARQAKESTAILQPDPRELSNLYRHMRQLRERYRRRFNDEDALWKAEPEFEVLVRSEARKARLVARR